MLHVKRWVLPTRVADSPREGEAGKLGRQSILSCLGVIVRLGLILIVVVVILFPHRGTTWHDAIVPAVVVRQLSYTT
jgi:hypothetical protein